MSPFTSTWLSVGDQCGLDELWHIDILLPRQNEYNVQVEKQVSRVVVAFVQLIFHRSSSSLTIHFYFIGLIWSIHARTKIRLQTYAHRRSKFKQCFCQSHLTSLHFLPVFFEEKREIKLLILNVSFFKRKLDIRKLCGVGCAQVLNHDEQVANSIVELKVWWICELRYLEHKQHHHINKSSRSPAWVSICMSRSSGNK